jgi:hypothetical protein
MYFPLGPKEEYDVPCADFHENKKMLDRIMWAHSAELTTEHSVVPNLRMGGATHLLPLYSFMAWTETNFYLD